MIRPGRNALDLGDLDPELAVNGSGRGAGTIRTVTVPAGRRLRRCPAGSGLGLYVVDGILLRHVRVGRARSLELVGQGDVIQPWNDTSDRLASIPAESEWSVLTPATLGLLDQAFVERAAQASPRLLCALFDRSIDRSRRLAYFLAIHNLVHVQDRLLLALWRLADRWGRVRGDGIVIAVPQLTHQLLAELVGARRPSVTTAVSQLTRSGMLRRDADGLWVLTGARPPDSGGAGVSQDGDGAAQRTVTSSP